MNTYNKDELMLTFWEHIKQSDSSSRKQHMRLKNEKSFLYLSVLKNKDGVNNLYYVFSDKKVNAVIIDEQSLFNAFSGLYVRKFPTSTSIESNEPCLFCFNTNQVHDWEYDKGTYQEFLALPVLSRESSLSSLINAISEYTRLRDSELFSLNEKSVDGVEIEIVYKYTCENKGYHSLKETGRIKFMGDVVGHYNLTSANTWGHRKYYTHDISKWNAMLEYIINSLSLSKDNGNEIVQFKVGQDMCDIAYMPTYEE